MLIGVFFTIYKTKLIKNALGGNIKVSDSDDLQAKSDGIKGYYHQCLR